MAIRAMVQGVAQKSFDPILIFLAHSPAACSASLSPNLTSLSPAPAEAIRLLASNATTQASILHLNSAPLYVQGTPVRTPPPANTPPRCHQAPSGSRTVLAPAAALRGACASARATCARAGLWPAALLPFLTSGSSQRLPDRHVMW
jgi:hypothetical protein